MTPTMTLRCREQALSRPQHELLTAGPAHDDTLVMTVAIRRTPAGLSGL